MKNFTCFIISVLLLAGMTTPSIAKTNLEQFCDLDSDSDDEFYWSDLDDSKPIPSSVPYIPKCHKNSDSERLSISSQIFLINLLMRGPIRRALDGFDLPDFIGFLNEYNQRLGRNIMGYCVHILKMYADYQLKKQQRLQQERYERLINQPNIKWPRYGFSGHQ
jgi:hypothetical protein